MRKKEFSVAFRGVQYFIRILLLPKDELFHFQCGKNE